MDTNEHKELYSGADLQAMRIAEESRLPGKNRVEEIISFARKAGINRIGIAYCFALRKEAMKLRSRLEAEFETYDINCLTGKIPSAELLGIEAKGLSCNPAGQALYLAENKTELNIAFGLCMGHDMIFSRKSLAPVTTLIVKDREHKHNPFKEFEDKMTD